MMTTEEWQSLVGSAGWPKFKQYMLDCRANVMEGLAQGKFCGGGITEAIVECQLLRNHAEISFEQLDRFYGVEPKEEANED